MNIDIKLYKKDGTALKNVLEAVHPANVEQMIHRPYQSKPLLAVSKIVNNVLMIHHSYCSYQLKKKLNDYPCQDQIRLCQCTSVNFKSNINLTSYKLIIV